MSSNIIQWFPGHMAKARREALEKMHLVDVVVELVDARIPESSRNPVIDEIINQKNRVIALNKSDLADPKSTQEWISYYEGMGRQAVAIDSQHNRGLRQLQNAIRKEMEPYFQRLKEKGVKPRPIRLMILGIPNVGKSTLINRFVGKNQAETGNRPGVTKAQRWLKIDRDFELLDTPGILWPKFENQEIGKKLALTGAIKDDLLHMDDIALYLLDYLREVGGGQVLSEQYPLKISVDAIEALSTVDLLLELTKAMNLRDDYDAASQRLVFDYRKGLLGQYTLDQVGESDE